jgi:hypothetical protein
MALERNRKGYSAANLYLKLRERYKSSPVPLNGCQLDSHILLEVLADKYMR